MKLHFVSAAFCLAGLASAQTTTWVNEPGGVAIATDAVDNVYTVRWDYNPGGDIYLAKRDVAGVLQWEVRYDNTDSTKHEVATWVDTDSAGNVLVSGTVRSGYSNPVNANSILMKFAPGGQLLWRSVYEGVFDGSSTRKLLVDGAGSIYVLGLGSGPSGFVTTVKKFAPNGDRIWSWFDGAGIGAPVNFKWTPEGALLISARAIYGSVNGYAKVDSNGQTIWSLPGIMSLTVGDAAGDAAGGTYLINGDYSTGMGSVLRRLGTSGATVWERTHPMAGFRVEVGTDGAPVVSGFPSSGMAGAAFMKFDSAGNFMWANLDADGPSVGLLAHARMLLDSDDSAYVAGGTMSQMGVAKVRSDGTADWTALISYGYSQGLSLGHQGRVFVTGGRTARIDQEDPSGFTSLCDPGLGGVIACPCSNPPSGPGRGCDNSASTGGAILTAAGGASLSSDSLVFSTSGERPAALSIVSQWTGQVPAGAVFGQGVRCASGTLKRLYTKTASGGSITAPSFGGGDLQVSVRSAALGDTILAGQSRWYLVYYRDGVVLGGCPVGSTFNATQTGQVMWSP
ncbi:MAG: hypothetical protein ACKVXR_03370 [Planctomycetota bacterium]